MFVLNKIMCENRNKVQMSQTHLRSKNGDFLPCVATRQFWPVNQIVCINHSPLVLIAESLALLKMSVFYTILNIVCGL